MIYMHGPHFVTWGPINHALTMSRLQKHTIVSTLFSFSTHHTLIKSHCMMSLCSSPEILNVIPSTILSSVKSDKSHKPGPRQPPAPTAEDVHSPPQLRRLNHARVSIFLSRYNRLDSRCMTSFFMATFRKLWSILVHSNDLVQAGTVERVASAVQRDTRRAAQEVCSTSSAGTRHRGLYPGIFPCFLLFGRCHRCICTTRLEIYFRSA